MLVELIAVVETNRNSTTLERKGARFRLEKTHINPDHVIRTADAPEYSRELQEGRFDTGEVQLDKRHEFTRLVIAEGQHSNSVTVVGSHAEVAAKLNVGAKRQLLKG